MLGYYPLLVWNTTVTANITTYHNTYTFSRPINLILPYALSLFISIPFLVSGYVSLQSNGFAATSDSFLQFLLTATRSENLDRMTLPCQFGGGEMATEELKNALIMFGELRVEKEDDVGRMGFGLEAEIKGYGMVDA